MTTAQHVAVAAASATVAIEDRRFYQHGGVDYVGIARAAWKDVTAGKVVEGGSTITQQLVRNLYTGQREDVQRARSRRRASRSSSSRKWPKAKILNEYLNTVYYGNHAYGVEAAAQTYFSKHASQLTLLAGGAARRACRRRRRSTTRSTTRRPRSTAATRCCARCSTNRCDHARGVRPRDPLQLARPEAGPHLHAHQAAVLLLVRDRRARAPVRREHRARRRPQGLYDDRSAAAAPREQGDPRHPPVQDRPRRGDRLGRARHRRDPRDDRRRAQRRATSSTSPRSRRARPARRSRRSCSPRRSRRASIRTRRTTPRRRSRARSARGVSAKPWDVHTYGNTYSGSESLTRATLQSDNTVYAQLTLDVGPSYVWQMAHRLGVHMSPDKPVASIGLGSLAVSPLDMAAAYATFPRWGSTRSRWRSRR